MKTRRYSQDATLVSRRVRAPKGKLLSLSTCLISLTLCAVLTITALGGYYFLSSRGQARTLVLIHAPQNGAHLIAGQPTTVQAVATDPRKIKRVELWVDGSLIDAETSNVPGGIASFPLLVDWRPAAGAHTVLVRAFNTLGTRTHSTINVNALADRDSDGAADDADACPDQQGLAVSNGCPDRDVDGTPDSADACPDIAGLPEAGGCATIAEGDRDGDGAPDAVDACPDAPGSPLVEGCSDSDGDMVADIHDACAAEPGAGGSDGCPVPAGDTDGDGVADSADVCPSEWGVPEHGGCPEVAGGVVPGGGTTDSDGDGSSDDADPCPTEAGLPENAFCPPPGDDPEPPDDGFVFEWPLWLFQTFHVSNFVEFEALHFEVSRHYREVWCYAKLDDGDMERYEFDPGLGRQWDIAEVLGGENSVHLALTDNAPVDVFVECYGISSFFFPMPHYLGSVTSQHPSEEWDGHVIEVESTGGEPGGHSFKVRYHLCSPSCEANALQPPVITHYTRNPAQVHLDWNWEGDRNTIEGFKLYLDGNLIRVLPRDATHTTWHHMGAFCADTWNFTLTAYGGPDPHHADIESAPGNTVAVEGVPCPKSVRVTFATLNLHHPPADEMGFHNPGPLAGNFTASAGANMENVAFDAVHCGFIPVPPFEHCWGMKLDGGTYSIQAILDGIHHAQDECGPGLCHADHYSASESDTVTLDVNPGDELTVAARIMDADVVNDDDVLFNERATINIDDLSPDSTYTLAIPGEYADLIVLVDLLPFDP